MLDKNDSPPSFKDTPLAYSISEDLSIGQPITTLHAVDLDTIGTLKYSIEDGDPDGHFELDELSGVLRLRDTVDREMQDAYKLLVRVSDTVQYTDTTVTITVRILGFDALVIVEDESCGKQASASKYRMFDCVVCRWITLNVLKRSWSLREVV